MSLGTLTESVTERCRGGRPATAAGSPEHASIGRFVVLRSLGRGAQGKVYLARDTDLDRLVAIKLLGAGFAGAAADGAWEHARNLARLRHPNIVALYEIGKSNEFVYPYLVFEYLEGTTLGEELKTSGARTLPDAYSAMLQITNAMAYVHAQGIVHLDLSPNNIMRDNEGKPRIMDFDLSQLVVEVDAVTDLAVGTLPYMAPECFNGQRLDKRTDVYALGRILCALLSGLPIQPTGTLREAVARAREQQTDWALLQRTDPAGHFVQVIRRATAKVPDERFADAGAMHDALIGAWQKTRPAVGAQETVIHGTVAFLLTRIKHRGDFPTVSRTLAEINSVTCSDEVSIPRLSEIVLRDYALTNRLLRLANSAYYARLGGKVKTVREAVIMLGINRVRIACNSLACLGHFIGRKDARLKEEVVASFISGLIARHLAGEAGIKDREEAFLAGMLFNLGKTLALFYFPEDYGEIEQLVARDISLEQAARSVLGVTFSELGHGVGETWSLPLAVLACMHDAPSPDDVSAASAMRAVVRFANTLAEAGIDRGPRSESVVACAERLRPHLALDESRIRALLQAAIEKFRSFAPALEVDFAESACVQRLVRWLAVSEEHPPLPPESLRALVGNT